MGFIKIALVLVSIGLPTWQMLKAWQTVDARDATIVSRDKDIATEKSNVAKRDATIVTLNGRIAVLMTPKQQEAVRLLEALTPLFDQLQLADALGGACMIAWSTNPEREKYYLATLRDPDKTIEGVKTFYGRACPKLHPDARRPRLCDEKS